MNKSIRELINAHDLKYSHYRRMKQWVNDIENPNFTPEIMKTFTVNNYTQLNKGEKYEHKKRNLILSGNNG